MNDYETIEELKNCYDKSWVYTTTSIFDLLPNTLSFINNEKYLKYISNNHNLKNINIIAPKGIEGIKQYNNIHFYLADNVSYVFGEVHNYIHQNRPINIKNIIHNNTQIHSSVNLDTEGIRLYHTPNGKKQLIHLSNIVIYEGTTIGSNTVIHRGVFKPTTIMFNVTIGSLVNIGHNCFIDNNTVITPGCVLAGSVRIGKDCWIGINSSFKHGLEICDNVVIGQHSNVRHNITESGIYAGDPLKKIKEYEKGWNF